MQPPPLEVTPEPPAETTSLVSRLLNVLATPGEVFDEVRRARPTPSNWLVPGILITIVGILGSWLVFTQPAIQQQLHEITSQAIEKQIETMKPSETQAEQMRTAGEKYGTMSAQISAYLVPLWSGFAIPFIWGLIVWLVARNAFKADVSLMKGVEIVGLAGMVTFLDAIIRTLLIMVTGNIFAAPSLVLLNLKDFNPQNPVHGLLALANVMVLWVLVVRSVGLARLAGVSVVKAAVWVFGIWVGYTGLLIGMGAAMQAVFSHAGK